MEFDPNEYPEKGGGGGNLLPAGKHIVRVIDHELTESSGGLDQVEVTFEAPSGLTRKAWLIAQGAAGWQLATLFRACGWTSKIDLSKPGMLKKAIYGKDVEIVVAEDTYNGKTSLKVKYINKAPEGGTRNDRDSGGGRSGRDSGRSGGGGGYSGGGGYGSQNGDPGVGSDDIPF